MATSRRGVLSGLVALAACAGGPAEVVDPTGAALDRVTADSPWWLIAPATAGTVLDGGWVVSDLSAVSRGAAVLLIQHPDGRELEVHLCAHGGRPRGPAHTVLTDLIVMNGGGPTEPSVRDALDELAANIQANELADDAALDLADDLLPHGDRVAIYGPDGI